MIFYYFHGKGIDAISDYQMQNIKKYNVDRIVFDQANDNFNVLHDTLKLLKYGDKVIVNSSSDFGNNLEEVINHISSILSRQSDLVILEDGLNSNQVNAISFKRMMNNLSTLNERKKHERIRNGIERAKLDGKYTGRKPIEIDSGLFDEIVSLWEQGKITARQAMSQLQLKPNTFYRRVKERKEIMKNQDEIFDAAKKLGVEIKKGVEYTIDDLEDLVEKVKKDYDEGTLGEKFQKEYADKKEMLDYYYDNAKGDVKRKLKDVKEYVELKMEVNKETRDYKSKE